MLKSLLTKALALPAQVKVWAVVIFIAVSSLGAFGGWAYWKGHHAASEAARPKIEAAQDQASVAKLNEQGAKFAGSQARAYHDKASDADAIVQAYLTSHPDTSHDQALPADRLARLRNADRELCNKAPELTGCRPAD